MASKEEIMEAVCDKCKEPFSAGSQDELDEICSKCPIAAMLEV